MAVGDIVRWISNSSTVWSTGANWAGGSPPGDREIAYCDGTGQADIAGSDEGNINPIRGLITHKSYAGNIATPGTPLQHNLDSATNNRARIVHRGSGELHFKGAATGGKFYVAFIDSPSAVTLDGILASGSGPSHVFVRGGTVTVKSTAVVQSGLYVVGVGADVTLEAAATTETAPPIIIVDAGLLTNHRVIAFTTEIVSVRGGKLIQKGIVSDSVWINIGVGGVFDYRPNAALTSVHNPHIYVGGVLDLSKSERQVSPDNFIIGPLGRVIGSAIQHNEGEPLSVDIDLREEYP